MASVKSPSGRIRRINRNGALQVNMEHTTIETTPGTYDENGNEVTPGTTATTNHPATSKLTISWREWKSVADQQLNETDPEVWFKDDGDSFTGADIVQPGADWQPKAESDEDAITQYQIAMSYLSMQKKYPEWSSDEK